MPEMAPPLSTDEIEIDLQNPTFAAYMYVGGEADPGWETAQIAFGLIPRLRVYLIKNISIIEKWIGNKTPAGVVFGFGNKVFQLLNNKSDAEDLQTVVAAIQAAMNQ